MTMCDDVDRMGYADREVTGMYIAAGDQSIVLADPALYRARLDEWLNEEPRELAPVDADRARLLKILGVT